MPRPSRHMDQRLLTAARELLSQTGFSRLTLRQVASRAGVNLGMFTYHFGTKRAFMRRVMQELYEDFFGKFTLETAAGAPVERLRKALLVLGRFAGENRQLLLALFRDVLEGETEIIRFLEKNFLRHVRIIVKIIRAGQRTGALRALPMPVALSHVAASVAGPNLVLAVLEHTRLAPPHQKFKASLLQTWLTEAVLEQRVSAAIQGLRPQASVAAKRRAAVARDRNRKQA